MSEVFLIAIVPLGLGWIGWVSINVVKNHDVKAQLDRIEEKLDNFIERFL